MGLKQDAAGFATLNISLDNIADPPPLVPGFPEASHDLIFQLNVHTLTDLMVLLYRVPVLLAAHPKVRGFLSPIPIPTTPNSSQISLLVLNSIHFHFQPCPTLNISVKLALLQKVKQIFALLTTKHNLTVRPVIKLC